MAHCLPFDQFWECAVAASRAGNGFCYHPCCDVWTSPYGKGKGTRRTHDKSYQWKRIISVKNIQGKKQALLAKMIEEEWRIPVVLDEACENPRKPIMQQQTAFRPRHPDSQSQDSQAGLSCLEFVYPDQLPSGLITPSSTHYFT